MARGSSPGVCSPLWPFVLFCASVVKSSRPSVWNPLEGGGYRGTMPCRLSFSCRQFRRQHAEYMDGYLSDEAQSACRAHRDSCPACERHDVQIRRSLIALQALPVIEPSAGFRDRLRVRLAQAALQEAPVHSRRIRWGVATAVIAASAALLLASSSRPTTVRQGAIQSGAIQGLTAIGATGHGARFEALPRQGFAHSWPSPMQGSPVRMRTVSYVGQ